MTSIETALQIKTALTSIGSSPVEDSQVQGEETDSLVTGMGRSWLYIVAFVAIVSAASSMFLTASILVDFASISVLVLAPIAIAQKQRLNRLGSMRSQHNELREMVNTISTENNTLKQSVSEMETVVDDLEVVEEELESIAQKSGGQVDRLVSIIQENAELQIKIKRNLEAQVMQNVLEIILKSDKNMDFNFDQSELKRLKLNLSNIPGVTFDAKNFEQKIGHKNLTLADVMAMFRNLKEDIPEEENIFHITPATIVKRGILFG